MVRALHTLLLLLAVLTLPARAQATTSAYRPAEESGQVAAQAEGLQDVADRAGPETSTVEGGSRFVAVKDGALPQGIARFGPFRVLDSGHAAMVDVTDSHSPAAFAAMVRAYPGIAEIVMLDCPGTLDDVANLRLGRMIHARGLATTVPDGGSVRSGAVELFLAGVHRSAAHGAEFAVHAWADDNGKEPGDFAEDAPVNRSYIDYYREMGMSAIEAHAFYDMTNSVPNASARWFSAAQMALWVRLD